MYKVKLTGHYNIFVKDLNFEFTPQKKTRIFSDEEFENSSDIKIFLGKYLQCSKCESKTNKAIKKVNKPVTHNVVEIPVAKELKKEEPVVVNATDSSKSTSANEKKHESKKEESMVIRADGAVEKDNTEEVKKLEVVGKSEKVEKTEPKKEIKMVETDKKEAKASSVKNNKVSAKKAGRPKKK